MFNVKINGAIVKLIYFKTNVLNVHLIDIKFTILSYIIVISYLLTYSVYLYTCI